MHETRLTIRLRWRDMDMLGHLNQAVYHELLEEARGALLMELAEGATVHQTYVVVRVELDYVSEVRKDHEQVDVVVRVAEVGTKSMSLDHEIVRPDGTVAARGRTVLVGWDAQARTSRPLGDEERARLRARIA